MQAAFEGFQGPTFKKSASGGRIAYIKRYESRELRGLF